MKHFPTVAVLLFVVLLLSTNGKLISTFFLKFNIYKRCELALKEFS